MPLRRDESRKDGGRLRTEKEMTYEYIKMGMV